MHNPHRVPWYVWTLAIALSALGFSFVGGCDREPAPPPAPVGKPSAPSLPVESAESTGEIDPCPWDGTCASLDLIDECDGWAVACRDGWRCVDLSDDFVCELPGSSSGGEGSTT